MNKKGFWTVCMLLGLLLIVGAGALVMHNLQEEANAGAESDAVMEELSEAIVEVQRQRQDGERTTSSAQVATEYEETVSGEKSVVMIDGKRYLGVLTFPTLGLQLPVMDEWSYANLRLSPCRYTGSEAENNLVILAHNYRTHFGPLRNNIKTGDQVLFTDMDGVTHTYLVSATEVVSPLATKEVTSGEWPLTLFTCTIGGRTRFVVRCDRAEE